MSLSHLFSGPQVEKAWGHTESGLRLPIIMRSTTSNRRGDAKAWPSTIKGAISTDTSTPRSLRSSRSWSNLHTKHASAAYLRLSRGTHVRGSEGLPLFQAYMGAIIYGTLELGHSPSRVESKPLFNGVVASVTLLKKIFVLLPSGQLLQYAENGLSNRLPERTLQLGKQSGAFACDLMPGRYYVLQVSKAVDAHGIAIVDEATALLSKFGIHNLEPRHAASRLLLVMESPADMTAWMSAIRDCIDTFKEHRPKYAMKARGPTYESSNTGDQKDRVSLARLLSKTSTDVAGDLLSPKTEDDMASVTSFSETVFEEQLDHLMPRFPAVPSQAQRRVPQGRSQRSIDEASIGRGHSDGSRSNGHSSSSRSTQDSRSSLESATTTSPSSANVPSTAYEGLYSYATGRREAISYDATKQTPLPKRNINTAVDLHAPYPLALMPPVLDDYVTSRVTPTAPLLPSVTFNGESRERGEAAAGSRNNAFAIFSPTRRAAVDATCAPAIESRLLRPSPNAPCDSVESLALPLQGSLLSDVPECTGRDHRATIQSIIEGINGPELPEAPGNNEAWMWWMSAQKAGQAPDNKSTHRAQSAAAWDTFERSAYSSASTPSLQAQAKSSEVTTAPNPVAQPDARQARSLHSFQIPAARRGRRLKASNSAASLRSVETMPSLSEHDSGEETSSPPPPLAPRKKSPTFGLVALPSLARLRDDSPCKASEYDTSPPEFDPDFLPGLQGFEPPPTLPPWGPLPALPPKRERRSYL
ncbi:hypothetical protein BAUCODRAFT_187889 [Baudoinia panamericana UAMH 10762]|uniref:PH domain-containing protein n=1 Tax=Baudoinia panamericana (strain UAMH 10762) TaxID=717646 RepID=M2N9K5_BAUPA|nr:uncharacterized protein BAUCODRAFT_187889 [Baudoinia panamericana UAMH 10762]EMD00874.1 hypothetical protein BAUCODRAFT_187889 [Baudoinia panamericana UAMH 10762]